MTPKIRKIIKRGEERWEVDLGIDPVTQVRKRTTYKTEAEAKKATENYKKEQRKFGEYWLRLAPQRRAVVVATLQAMESRGVTVERVWTEWQIN